MAIITSQLKCWRMDRSATGVSGKPLEARPQRTYRGMQNNGTYSGGITFGQPGFHGGDTAALFDGATGRIIVPNSNSLNPPHITMEAKVRWDGPNDFHQRILEKSSFPELAQYGLGILTRWACAGGDPHQRGNNQRQRRQRRRGRAGH